MAIHISGTWDMVHDDWQGVLKINPSDQETQGTDGPCTYIASVIDGQYTDHAGTSHQMRGSFRGHDPNDQTSRQCKQSDHMIRFTIAFPNEPPQQFLGYVFTHQGKSMAGYTWWQGIPFGWYATRR